jgi:hypothetical protein
LRINLQWCGRGQAGREYAEPGKVPEGTKRTVAQGDLRQDEAGRGRERDAGKAIFRLRRRYKAINQLAPIM